MNFDLADSVTRQFRRTLREQFCILHRRLLAIVREDDVCRGLMTTPGVGPVVSLTYRATLDVPVRFRKYKSVGGGLWIDVCQVSIGRGRLERKDMRCGDEMMRVMGIV